MRSVHAEGDDGLATAMEPVQSLAEEQNFPELYAVFVQQQLPLSMLLQFQPEPLLPAQELPLKHDASVCTSKSSAVAREERRIGHLPPRSEARRLSTVGLRKRRWLSGARRQARNVRPIGHPNGRGVWGWGWVRRELAHAGAAERSPPPGPQRWAADRVRRRRRLEATLGFENQREIA